MQTSTVVHVCKLGNSAIIGSRASPLYGKSWMGQIARTELKHAFASHLYVRAQDSFKQCMIEPGLHLTNKRIDDQ